jgi:hypothetical protein
MKLFLKKILGIFFSIIIIAFITDSLINLFFRNYHQRSKPDVKNQNVNIVFFGSSRCVHHIIPSLYDSLNSTKSFNMGWAASYPREIYAAVKLYLHFNKPPQKIILQLDLEAENTGTDALATQSLIKHFNQHLIDDYFTSEQNFNYKIPLYACTNYRDYSWREILKTIFRNKPQTIDQGYIPIKREFQKDNLKDIPPNVPLKFLATKNIWVIKTIELCKKNGIGVTLFTAPYYQIGFSERFNKFSQYNCPYFNLSKTLKDSRYFSDNSHLNNLGATLFTQILSDSMRLGQSFPNKVKTNLRFN